MNNFKGFYASSNFYNSFDNLKLHYRDIGTFNKDPVILCLPGLTRNSRDFDEFATKYSQNYRVLCPDLRGRGLSEYDPNWQNYHPQTYAQDIWTLLDHLCIEKVIIVGTSLGGLIAMVMSSQKNNRVAGVVLNDIGPEIDQKGLDRIKSYAGILPPVASWKEAVELTKKIYGPWLIGINDNQWMILAKRAYKSDSHNRPVLDVDPNINRAINHIGTHQVDQWALFNTLKDIQTLVLRGELSDILSKETLIMMHDENPNLISTIIPNRGHVPLLNEQTSLLAINNFLKRIPS